MGSYSTGFAKSYEQNCFREHIQESIAINKERKKEYGKITDGKSDRIFNLLINLEHLSLAFAVYYDFRARPFQKKGLDLFCHEFMSMNKVHEFSTEKKKIPEHGFDPIDLTQFKTEVRAALKRKDHEKLMQLTSRELSRLTSMPMAYCMTRHMLESMYRFAFFVNIRESEARELGVSSPKDLLLDVFKTHLLSLTDAIKIDTWAWPIQREGIPLLCSELPDLLHDLPKKRE